MKRVNQAYVTRATSVAQVIFVCKAVNPYMSNSIPMLIVRPHVDVAHVSPATCASSCSARGGYPVVQNKEACVCMIPDGNQTQLIAGGSTYKTYSAPTPPFAPTGGTGGQKLR